jgi:hypothetical protein
MITPDGTVLQSFHRHDYKSHTDTVSGETYFLDGGTAYIRSSVNNVKPTWDIMYVSDPHERKRMVPVWGTYGKNGDQPIKYISISDMEDQHILNILDSEWVNDNIRDALEFEIGYRKDQ